MTMKSAVDTRTLTDRVEAMYFATEQYFEVHEWQAVEAEEKAVAADPQAKTPLLDLKLHLAKRIVSEFEFVIYTNDSEKRIEVTAVEDPGNWAPAGSILGFALKELGVTGWNRDELDLPGGGIEQLQKLGAKVSRCNTLHTVDSRKDF